MQLQKIIVSYSTYKVYFFYRKITTDVTQQSLHFKLKLFAIFYLSSGVRYVGYFLRAFMQCSMCRSEFPTPHFISESRWKFSYSWDILSCHENRIGYRHATRIGCSQTMHDMDITSRIELLDPFTIFCFSTRNIPDTQYIIIINLSLMNYFILPLFNFSYT